MVIDYAIYLEAIMAHDICLSYLTLISPTLIYFIKVGRHITYERHIRDTTTSMVTWNGGHT